MPTKILAIDDSKTMRLAIKITFAAEDFEVVAVSKGSEAVARAKQMPADVLIVDAALAAGEPSGYEVVRQVRADPETAHIPVILLVSNQVGIDEAQVQSCGANGAMTKPFDTQEMLDKVTALAQGKAITTSGRAPAKPAPAPVATTAAKPAPVAQPAPTPVASKPAPAPVQTPAPTTSRPAPTPVASTPAARPSAGAAAKNFPAAFASGEDMASKIPIATPIPFTSADSPTPGILKRLQAAGGGAGNLDPKAVAALVALSRDVIEQVVWEVVPDMAEQILKRQQPRS